MKSVFTIPLAELRGNAHKMPTSTAKDCIIAVSKEINKINMSTGTADGLAVKEEKLKDLLRRRSILEGALVTRGFHLQKDSADYLAWINKEAKPDRKSF